MTAYSRGLKVLSALTLLGALAALMLYAAIPAGAGGHWIDYDVDDDGLIDIRTIGQLQGIRWDHDGNGWIAPGFRSGSDNDLDNYNAAFPGRQRSAVDALEATSTRMGCPAVCVGYELMNDLDFANVTTSQRYWTNGYGYAGILEGNGYTIANMNNDDSGNGGLFGVLEAGGEIRNLGLINPIVIGTGGNGALAGYSEGKIIASYSRGGSVTYRQNIGAVGGLVGRNAGAIIASFATVHVTRAGDISSSGVYNGGGLVGDNDPAGIIIASYAAGSVRHTASGGAINVGGLVGRVQTASSTVADSYCDTTVNGTSTPCIGIRHNGAVAVSAGYTTGQLQTPTGYTGIYRSWDVSTTTASGFTLNDPWDFLTSDRYPLPVAFVQRIVDPGNGNLDNVDTLDEPDGIRYGLDGDDGLSGSDAAGGDGDVDSGGGDFAD